MKCDYVMLNIKIGTKQAAIETALDMYLVGEVSVSLSSVNSLSSGRYDSNMKCVNFKHNLGINILIIQVNSILEWMPEGLQDWFQ